MRHNRTFFAAALLFGAALILAASARATVPFLEKTGKIFFADDSHVCEVTPFLWEGKMLLILLWRTPLPHAWREHSLQPIHSAYHTF